MNQTFRIIIVGVLSCLSLGVKAADDDDTKEKLFNPVNYAVISQTIAPDARGGGLGDVGAATDGCQLPVLEPGKVSVQYFACRCLPELHPLAAFFGQ